MTNRRRHPSTLVKHERTFSAKARWLFPLAMTRQHSVQGRILAIGRCCVASLGVLFHQAQHLLALGWPLSSWRLPALVPLTPSRSLMQAWSCPPRKISKPSFFPKDTKSATATNMKISCKLSDEERSQPWGCRLLSKIFRDHS